MSATEGEVRLTIMGGGWGRNVQARLLLGRESGEESGQAGIELAYLWERKDQGGLGGRSGTDVGAALEARSSGVSIVTPPGTHVALIGGAARHGHRRILCDKPPALEAGELLRLREGLRGAPGGGWPDLRFDLELRLLPTVRRLRELLGQEQGQEQGQGPHRGAPILHVETSYTGDRVLPAQLLALAASGHRRPPPSTAGPVPQTFNWWACRAHGGGIWGAIGSHLVDAVQFVCRSQVVSVQADLATTVPTRPGTSEREVEHPASSDDHARVMGRLRCGAPFHVTASVVTPGPPGLVLVVTTATGAYRLSGPTLEWIPTASEAQLQHQIAPHSHPAAPHPCTLLTLDPALWSRFSGNAFLVGTWLLRETLAAWLAAPHADADADAALDWAWDHAAHDPYASEHRNPLPGWAQAYWLQLCLDAARVASDTGSRVGLFALHDSKLQAAVGNPYPLLSAAELSDRLFSPFQESRAPFHDL